MYIDVTIQFVTKQSICTEAGVWIERSIILPSWLECESTDTLMQETLGGTVVVISNEEVEVGLKQEE